MKITADSTIGSQVNILVRGFNNELTKLDYVSSADPETGEVVIFVPSLVTGKLLVLDNQVCKTTIYPSYFQIIDKETQEIYHTYSK